MGVNGGEIAWFNVGILSQFALFVCSCGFPIVKPLKPK
jgi:hypothetical protein